MLEVYPAINCAPNDTVDVREKLRVATGFARRVHLDSADGILTFNRSWGDPHAWGQWKFPLELEVHLMHESPMEMASAWLAVGAKRLIFQAESFLYHPAHLGEDPAISAATAAMFCQENGAEAMLSILPETRLSTIGRILPLFHSYQVFAQAHLGPSGQPFLLSVLPRIVEIKKMFPDATIEVDGGINPHTAALVARAGASVVISGSYIFKAADPAAAYRDLTSE
jgi:ribulose-phosphate 3-epimerase